MLDCPLIIIKIIICRSDLEVKQEQLKMFLEEVNRKLENTEQTLNQLKEENRFPYSSADIKVSLKFSDFYKYHYYYLKKNLFKNCIETRSSLVK